MSSMTCILTPGNRTYICLICWFRCIFHRSHRAPQKTRAVYELKGRKKYKLCLMATGKGGLKDFRKHLSDRKVHAQNLCRHGICLTSRLACLTGSFLRVSSDGHRTSGRSQKVNAFIRRIVFVAIANPNPNPNANSTCIREFFTCLF